MITFTNATTKEKYESVKDWLDLTIEDVPDTEKGFESCRKYITMNGYRYFVSMNTEKDYYINLEDDFSVWFRSVGDKITVLKAVNKGKKEKSDRFLKKYTTLLCSVHSVLKYEKCLKFVPYYAKEA